MHDNVINVRFPHEPSLCPVCKSLAAEQLRRHRATQAELAKLVRAVPVRRSSADVLVEALAALWRSATRWFR